MGNMPSYSTEHCVVKVLKLLHLVKTSIIEAIILNFKDNLSIKVFNSKIYIFHIEKTKIKLLIKFLV